MADLVKLWICGVSEPAAGGEGLAGKELSGTARVALAHPLISQGHPHVSD